MKGLIDFTNNCKLWTSSITNPNYNMLSNNLQQCLNFPGLIYNNYVNDNGYHYNTFNFNIFPLSILGNLENGLNNNVYENLKGFYMKKEANNNNNSNNNSNVSNNKSGTATVIQENINNFNNNFNLKPQQPPTTKSNPSDMFKHDETLNNNPFSISFNFEDYSGNQINHNEEKEFNNIDFNEKNNYDL
jgi:hypothetical protein